jgi:hypothetical protein
MSAKIINLTIARNMYKMWRDLSDCNPYKKKFHKVLDELSLIPDFSSIITNILSNELTISNVDLVCHVVEKYYPNYINLLNEKSKIHYIRKRIENSKAIISGEKATSYIFAFPEIKINNKDPRVSFLEQVLDFVEFIKSDHQTIKELLSTPYFQYEQMIQYISTFPHEKIPFLLEKLSYVDNTKYARMTISPIGNYKTPNSLEALENLEKYYLDYDTELLPLIYETMQKLAFNQPAIV